MKRRLTIARALINEPELLVLDEPNSSLDRVGEQALLDTIDEMRRRGVTIVVIAHRPSMLEHVDKIRGLREGRIEMVGRRDEVMAKLMGPQTPAGPAFTVGDVGRLDDDGYLVASVDDIVAMGVWSVDDGKSQAALTGHKGLVLSLCYSPDGLLLASGERHGQIRIWSTSDSSLKTTLPGHSGGKLGFSCHALDFSSDGKQLASAGRDKMVRLWEIPD